MATLQAVSIYPKLDRDFFHQGLPTFNGFKFQ